MNSRICATAATVLASVAAVLALLGMLGGAESGAHPAALAAPVAPTVSAVDPSSAPNDLDTSIVITGTAFETDATITLGSTALDDAGRVSSTTLTATVPWGLDPGVYTLTVENPGGSVASLTDAFTVTPGINTWNAGELYGGSMQWLLVNPVTPTTLYAASAHAGLFRSRDGGQSWSFQFAGGADYPAIDPDAPHRLYLFGASGLERSNDAGESWSTLDPKFPYTNTLGDRCSTSSIVPYVHPISDTVYALACHANYQGLIKSDDHGETWESISEGITDTQITALAFHPKDAERIYVGTGNGHIFASSNGGVTWTHAARPVGCVGALAVNPFGDHGLWVASDDTFGDPCVLRKSTRSDLTTWKTLTGTGEGCFWPRPSIDFASHFSGTVFLSGFGFSGLKTTDGGESWQELHPGGGALVNAVAFHPTQSETLYLADKWEGVYKTTDGGESWTVSHQGLTALYPLEMVAHPERPDVVYARLNSEELYKGTRGGEIWERMPISRVASVQIDPITPTQIYVGRSGDPAYVYVSDDGGRTWKPSTPLPQAADCEGWSFPWTLLALPQQPGTLLVGVQHYCGSLPHPGNIYRSVDFGASWENVYTHTYNEYSSIDFGYDPLKPSTVYAAIPRGEDGLLKSIDSGATWTSLGVEDVSIVEVQPRTQHIFIQSHSVCGQQSSSLCFSADGGENWESVGDSPHGIDGFAFAPGDSSLIYAHTDQGLLRSVDGGQSWNAAAGALGHVPIYSLETVTDTDRLFLYAGTTGGRVQETGALAQGIAVENGLVNAGVYRYTTRQMKKLYLPLILREAP
jgi:photosystem II stability/assembly factor-like uncharacterized protein